MKRRIGIIALLVLLLAGLVAVCIAVQKRNDGGDEPSVPEDTGVTVSEIKSGTVQSFSVENAAGSISLTCYSDVWKLDGQPDFPVDQNVAYTVVSALCKITARRQLRAGEVDLTSAGLTQPVATVTVMRTDGSRLSYRLGNYNSAAGALYLMTDDDSWVYLTESNALRELTGVTKMGLAQVDTVPDATVVRSVTVGADNTDNQTARSTAWSGLEFAAAVDFAPDAEALAGYGLDEETRQTVTVEYTVTTQVESNEQSPAVRYDTEYTAVLHVGAVSRENPSYTYAMLGNSQMVCVVPTERVASLVK